MGSEMCIRDRPVIAPYGKVVIEDRIATIKRAIWFHRLWTKLIGNFEFMEICEFSFSEEISL